MIDSSRDKSFSCHSFCHLKNSSTILSIRRDKKSFGDLSLWWKWQSNGNSIEIQWNIFIMFILLFSWSSVDFYWTRSISLLENLFIWNTFDISLDEFFSSKQTTNSLRIYSQVQRSFTFLFYLLFSFAVWYSLITKIDQSVL